MQRTVQGNGTDRLLTLAVLNETDNLIECRSRPNTYMLPHPTYMCTRRVTDFREGV